MSDFQLTSLPDEVTPQSEIWFCSERSCWWGVMKRNRAVWQKWLWSGSGKEPKHLLFTCLSILNLSRPSEGELRAAVAIETKQDGQHCRGRGRRSGMNRLSLCSLVKDSKRSLNYMRKKRVISCFGESPACLTFDPARNLWENEQYSTRPAPLSGQDADEPAQNTECPGPEKCTSQVKVDRWSRSTSSLI